LGTASGALNEIPTVQEFTVTGLMRASVSIGGKRGVVVPFWGKDLHIGRCSAQLAWQVLDALWFLTFRTRTYGRVRAVSRGASRTDSDTQDVDKREPFTVPIRSVGHFFELVKVHHRHLASALAGEKAQFSEHLLPPLEVQDSLLLAVVCELGFLKLLP
jgi:hypothetical protein